MYLQFLSFLHTDMTEAVEILVYIVNIMAADGLVMQEPGRESAARILTKSNRDNSVSANKVWWQCPVPTSTTRFASDVGYRMVKM